MSADQVAAMYVRDSGAKIWDAFSHADAGGITAFYDDDAALMPPNAPIVKGKAAIAAALADEFKQFTVKSVDGRVSDVNVGRNLAVETGTYTFALALKDGAPVSETGKYMHVWRKTPDGQWKVIRYMSSSDAPAKFNPACLAPLYFQQGR